MALFAFTEEDIARDKLVAPGWYVVQCMKVEDKAAKTDGSNNTWITWKGMSGDAAMVEVAECLNEKFAPNAKKLIAALTGAKVEAGVQYKIDAGLVEKQLEAFIAPGDVNGTIRNTIKDYRPLTQQATS